MNKNRDEANVGGMQYFYDKVYRSYAAIQKARCADARKPLSQSSPGEWFVCGRGGPEGRRGELRRKRRGPGIYLLRLRGDKMRISLPS